MVNLAIQCKENLVCIACQRISPAKPSSDGPFCTIDEMSSASGHSF